MPNPGDPHWLDQVLALPIIGLRMESDFGNVFRYPEVLIPELRKYHENKVDLNYIPQNPIKFSLRGSHGFTYDISHDAIVVKFQYNVVQITRPGKVPGFQIKDAAPYSELLQTAREEINIIYKALWTLAPIKMNRIGIVASCRLDPNTIPPGLEQYIEHLGETSEGSLVNVDSTLLTELNSDEKTHDRCHHILKFDKTSEPNQISLTLDWQRALLESDEIAPSEFKARLDDPIRQALQYFQSFGIGSSCRD